MNTKYRIFLIMVSVLLLSCWGVVSADDDKSFITGKIAYQLPSATEEKFNSRALITLGYEHGVAVGDSGGVWKTNKSGSFYKVADLVVTMIDQYMSLCVLKNFAVGDPTERVSVRVNTKKLTDSSREELANSAFETGNYPRAKFFYKNISKINNPERYQLACQRIESCTEQIAQAKSRKLTASEIDILKAKTPVYLQLAVYYFMYGDYMPARKYTEKVLRVDDHNKDALALLDKLDNAASRPLGVDNLVSAINCWPEENGFPARDAMVIFDSPPEMTKQVVPVYPRQQKLNGIEGIVWVQALVDKDGEVPMAIVAKSSGSWALDYSAVTNAYSCKYKSAIKNHKKVSCWVTYKVDFTLKN